MIPTFVMRITVDLPPQSPSYAAIVDMMRAAVQDVTKRSVQIAQVHAPGATLYKDIAGSYEDTAAGGLGTVWMPYQFRFTLPPGTQEHYIPGGLSVSSYQEAAQIQVAKGYPMGFYWEREGYYAYRWSVFHPGYKGSPWGDDVYEEVGQLIDKANQDVADHVARRWGNVAR